VATWRSIEGYPDYLVSDEGEIARKLKCSVVECKPGHFRKYVRLGGRSGPLRQVCHLVMEAFRRGRPEGKECAHLDDNPMNNRVENLRWMTHAENMSAVRGKGK